jgi:transposase
MTVAEQAKQIDTSAFPQDIADAHAVIADLQTQIEQMRQHLARLNKYIFGRRSEKERPEVEEQGTLPFATEEAIGPELGAALEAGDAELSQVHAHTRRKHPGRHPLPKDLPRQEIVLDVAEADKHCVCCDAPKLCIGQDSTESLDYNPASLFIVERIRPKYACPRCQQGVVQASLPPRPIDKGVAEPGLLAHVVTMKHDIHVPLFRIQQLLSRHGVEISRGLLAEWIGKVADLMEPVAGAVHAQLLESRYIQSDDTGIKVQAEGECDKAHMWVYCGEGGERVYDFSWHRNRDGPLKMLDKYQGYLQADAAPAYDDVYATKPIIEVGCMAHARRYFVDAKATSPVEATQIVRWMGELYGLEKAAKANGLNEAERKELRQQKAVPILERIETFMKEITPRALPKSPLGQAITYAQNQWVALNRYVEHGALKIDNNGAERAIKPFVIGRKGWLFVGNEVSGHRTAILCTLVNTCKAYAIDPFVYLRDVIERVSTHPMSRISELTPREWKRLRAEASDTTSAA